MYEGQNFYKNKKISERFFIKVSLIFINRIIIFMSNINRIIHNIYHKIRVISTF